MKCPHCGSEMVEGHLICEICGEEIRIVPDFEPEIENSISETLSTLVSQQEETDEAETADGESGNGYRCGEEEPQAAGDPLFGNSFSGGDYFLCPLRLPYPYGRLPDQ